MLQEIYIKNIAIIEELELEFKQGLNIITGETGSGKSILLQALKINTGTPFPTHLMKDKTKESIIECRYHIQNPNNTLKEVIDKHNNIVITRKFRTNGANTIRLNHESIPLKKLKEITKHILNITNQHDQINLIDPSVQLQLLDQFGKKELKKLKEDFQIQFKQYKDEEKKYQINQSSPDTLHLDFIKFQINELNSANIKENEEEQLNHIKKQLKNKDKIISIQNSLNQNIKTIIESQQQLIKEIEKTDLVLLEKETEILNKHLVETEDIKQTIQQLNPETNENSPQNIDEIESRLDELFKLKIKYKANSIPELILIKKQRQEQLTISTNNQEWLKEQLKKVNTLKKASQEAANKLHQKRIDISQSLTKQLTKNLKQLNFNYLNLKINTVKLETLSKEGASQIEIALSTNAGHKPQPLADISSGGELSRILLALT